MAKKTKEEQEESEQQDGGRDAKGRFTAKNLFSVNYGRPAKFNSEEELCLMIVDYFEYADRVHKGKYSIADLCLFLGFESRQSFYDYMKKDGFSYTMNRVKTVFEGFHEKKLGWGGSFMGAKFWLMNFAGWREEVTQNQNQTINKVEIIEKTRED